MEPNEYQKPPPPTQSDPSGGAGNDSPPAPSIPNGYKLINLRDKVPEPTLEEKMGYPRRVREAIDRYREEEEASGKPKPTNAAIAKLIGIKSESTLTELKKDENWNKYKKYRKGIADALSVSLHYLETGRLNIADLIEVQTSGGETEKKYRIVLRFTMHDLMKIYPFIAASKSGINSSDFDTAFRVWVLPILKRALPDPILLKEAITGLPEETLYGNQHLSQLLLTYLQSAAPGLSDETLNYMVDWAKENGKDEKESL